MYFQFGQRKLLPPELVNLIWSYDDRYKILFRNCVDEMNKCFYKNRLTERLRFELDIFNSICDLYPNSPFFYSYGYMSSPNKPTYSVYILNRIKRFGDRVTNENLPHFTFKNYL